MSAFPLSISVIIATRNRCSSLEETLEGLLRSRPADLHGQVIVVDNGSSDGTRALVESFSRGLVRYLFEPQQGEYGKSHALNRALDSAVLADLVAVLDDDMSVAPGWWEGIMALSRRHADADLFAGSSYIIWPDGPIPDWARNPLLQGWLFSVRDGGLRDHLLQAGQWFSGNFFWFRSRLMRARRRFPDTWLTEPQFILQLVNEGYRGVQGPDAVAGHRIQRTLLDPHVALQRAVISGRAFAHARLVPFRPSVPNARRARTHPLLARAYCAAAASFWSWKSWRLRKLDDHSPRFAEKLTALQRQAACTEALRLLRTEPAYCLLPKTRLASNRVQSSAGVPAARDQGKKAYL